MSDLNRDEQLAFLECMGKLQKELDSSFQRYERLSQTTKELQEQLNQAKSKTQHSIRVSSIGTSHSNETLLPNMELIELRAENATLKQDARNFEQISSNYAKGMEEMVGFVSSYTEKMNMKVKIVHDEYLKMYDALAAERMSFSKKNYKDVQALDKVKGWLLQALEENP
ncbi:SIP/FAR complex subunit Csc4 [Schizosaccharomyces osmophilus]|uniref:SIP/FAR complex subunit Csc4 n=1 Tax=Schizosaccharomyces osmophilus TaxID=2545709 RepID=A0AAE9WFB3_9SCHI|nr:SIP/FAR complex subunit Csc4 [Schizosaccharomyces osmophilus]WBW74226.1 SIP/FAR complex subunit Csc4 [Schizosaccharomyces osmophilus]